MTKAGLGLLEGGFWRDWRGDGWVPQCDGWDAARVMMDGGSWRGCGAWEEFPHEWGTTCVPDAECGEEGAAAGMRRGVCGRTGAMRGGGEISPPVGGRRRGSGPGAVWQASMQIGQYDAVLHWDVKHPNRHCVG